MKIILTSSMLMRTIEGTYKITELQPAEFFDDIGKFYRDRDIDFCIDIGYPNQMAVVNRETGLAMHTAAFKRTLEPGDSLMIMAPIRGTWNIGVKPDDIDYYKYAICDYEETIND